MSLHAILPLIEPVLRALEVPDPVGLQLYSASHLAALHHPPLNPDLPALLACVEPVDLDAIRRVLLNQYPGTHPVQIVRGDQTVEQFTLETLVQATSPDSRALIYITPLPQASSFERFQEIIAHLRAPEGCPWDRKQTHSSLRPYLLEETYEVLEALDAGDMVALREELGDLLLQVVLHSQVAVDAGTFRMGDIIAGINSKIIRRHPHVWGSVEANDDEQVKVNWDRLKQAEKQANGDEKTPSRLDGVSKVLPALSQALSYQDRAARVKFDWDTIEPVIAKIHEEIEEVLTAPDAESREKEIGDLLFAVVNWARWLKIDPEGALRGTNGRFYQRFYYVEQQAAAQNRPLDQMSLAEMDALWEEAKSNGL
ncbi:MAG: nucleoside triphosphate pyrophosphohydrolase [Chloroflexi bacterium]|nr:nucleoside triphosphate pyrophosphohydrolase [Chloroflexota bacterium]